MRATDDAGAATGEDDGPAVPASGDGVAAMHATDPADPAEATLVGDGSPVRLRPRSRARTTTAGGVDQEGVLDVSAKLADYREPTEAGIADDLNASQPAASEGQDRSGRSLRASNIGRRGHSGGAPSAGGQLRQRARMTLSGIRK